VPLQGYANGWPLAAPGCRSLRLRFAPESTVRASLVLSGVGGGVMALLLLAGAARRCGRRRAGAAAPALLAGAAGPPVPGSLPDPPPLRLAPRAALAWGGAAALVIGFVFALRAGAVAGPLVALLLWRGPAVRTLFTAAGGLLLLAVPALYVAHVLAADRGNPFDTTFATDRLAAHWVAVAAVVLLALGLLRQLGVSRPRGR
jgi:hypothetical protein